MGLVHNFQAIPAPQMFLVTKITEKSLINQHLHNYTYNLLYMYMYIQQVCNTVHVLSVLYKYCTLISVSGR